MLVKIFTQNRKGQFIVFEEISFLTLPLLAFYILTRQSPLYFFSISPALQQNSIIQKMVIEKTIIKIVYSDIDLIQQLDLNKVALDTVEKIYEENFWGNETVAKINNLVGSDSATNAFKKRLLLNLYEFYRMNLFFDHIFAPEGKKGDLVFVPGRICSELKNIPQIRERLDEKINLQTSFGAVAYRYASTVFLRVKYCFIVCCFPFWILLKIRIPSRKSDEPKKFSVGIRISNSDWPLGNKYRRFDFLVDGVSMTRTNTLFCIEEPIADSAQRKIDEKGYSSVEIRNILRNADLTYCKNIIVTSFLPTYLTCLKKSFSDPLFITQYCTEILFRYLVWTRFKDKFQIHHYVSYNEHLPSDIIRNIVLENQKVSTWLYAHSIGTNDFMAPPGHPEIMEKIYAYFHYEHYIVWGEKMEQYYRKHPNTIKNFHKLGCLWSEHVRIITEERAANTTLNTLHKKFAENNERSPKKIIGVFDVSTGADAPLTETDIIEFINGILRVADEHPEYGIIFKKKWSYKKLSTYAPNLVKYYQKIEAHPRCYLTDEMDSDPSETIAAADLVISAPFTSPTIESLGARKKALYFDSTGRFPATYYDHFPRFVAHDSDELKRVIDYWLNEITDEEFNAFLTTYILNELDEYLDGLAITRFRSLLCS